MSLSWILRGLGMLALLPVIFTQQAKMILPGLLPVHFQFMLFGGSALFIAGAITFHFARTKERALRKQAMNEEEV